MSGSLNFNLSNPALTGLVILFILAAAFLEEVTFRGLILHGMMRAWGSTSRGPIRSVLISSLLFCSIHLLDFLSGRPLLNVLLQGLQAFFLGIFLAALVLKSKSIYPAVLFHTAINLAGYLSFASQGIEPPPSAWLMLSLIMLPLATYGINLLRGQPERPIVQTAEGD
jgi:membrane protease YdiL (CAAX protease family)